MAQENNKSKPDLYDKSNGDKSPRRPRFSIYWIYALVAITLIAVNVFKFNKPDSLPRLNRTLKRC
jgi:cell division protease FtsH